MAMQELQIFLETLIRAFEFEQLGPQQIEPKEGLILTCPRIPLKCKIRE